MRKLIIYLFVILVVPFFSIAQEDPAVKELKTINRSVQKRMEKKLVGLKDSILIKQNSDRTQYAQCGKSEGFNLYYGRYDYQKDVYDDRNEMLIPLVINVWQKSDSTGNYIDTPYNREVWERIIENLDYFYSNIVTSSEEYPWVTPYESTKIRFKLVDVYYNQSDKHWKMGQWLYHQEGIKLNAIADSLHPKQEGIFKIHITAGNPRAAGFGHFPNYNMDDEHYVVSFNKAQNEHFDPDFVNAWGFAMHLAHELGHNLDLYHTYEVGFKACKQDDPDYLDDVFGRGEDAICPRDGGWDCDLESTEKTCNNNIMGGSKGGRYFSPKQVQRMHRALSLKSIRNYAIPYNFDEKRFFIIDKYEVWDFNVKMFNSIRIKKGATLIIKCEVEFVPDAEVIIEKGGKLIVDGGTLTNEKFYQWSWNGITDKNNLGDGVEVINGGKIRYDGY